MRWPDASRRPPDAAVHQSLKTSWAASLREPLELFERDAELVAARRQRQLFGAADYPVRRADAAECTGDGGDVG